MRINQIYSFESGTVGTVTRTSAIRDARGQVVKRLVEMDCEGDLFGDSTRELIQKQDAMIAALGQATEIALYDNLGIRTGSVIRSINSDERLIAITGLEFPRVDGGQWVNQLNFRFRASVVVPVPTVSPGLIINFQESISRRGNGAGRILAQEGIQGPVQMILLTERTKFITVQQGTATGYRGRPRIPAPIWPQYLQNPDAAVQEMSGMGIGSLEYTTNWQYVYESDVRLVGLPNVWV